MDVFDLFLAFFALQQKFGNDEIVNNLLLTFSFDSHFDMLDRHFFANIRPILFRLSLKITKKKYASSWIMEVTEHDD